MRTPIAFTVRSVDFNKTYNAGNERILGDIITFRGYKVS